MTGTWLTPDEARDRFGELTVAVGTSGGRVYSAFERPEGLWRPEYDRGPSGLVLRGYRLHPPIRPVTPLRPVYKPRRK